MEIVAGINPRMKLHDVAEYARRVESMGFDTLHIPEMVHDPFVVSSLALSATTTLHVRTGVALAFVRSPVVSALSAWDLAHLSHGRFDLGLGTQIRKNIEERYGMPFSRPVSRMRSYVLAVRSCFESFIQRKCVPYQDDFYNLSLLQDAILPENIGNVRVPEIWLGAVGPRMTSLAAGLCDGLITHPTNSHHLHLKTNVIPVIKSSVSDGVSKSIPVVAAPLTVITDDPEERKNLVEDKKRLLAFLYSTPAYAPTLESLGFADLGKKLRDRISQNDTLDSHQEIPDTLFNQVVLTSTYEELAEEVLKRFGGFVDGITLRPPTNEKHDNAFGACIDAIKQIT